MQNHLTAVCQKLLQTFLGNAHATETVYMAGNCNTSFQQKP